MCVSTLGSGLSSSATGTDTAGNGVPLAVAGGCPRGLSSTA